MVNKTPWIGTYELEIYKFPWEQYIPRIRTVKVVYGAKYLHQYCFRNYPALESVELPESLTTIDNYVFSGCTSLRHVQLPDSLQSIGYEAFYNCTSLEEIDLPDHLVTLRGYAFAGCTALQEIDLPDSLTEFYIANQGLDYNVFLGCTALKKARLPVALERIPSGLFKGCTSLTEVEMCHLATQPLLRSMAIAVLRSRSLPKNSAMHSRIFRSKLPACSILENKYPQ